MCVRACTTVHHVWACCLQRSEDHITSSGTGLIDGWGLPCGHWESNPGLLQEQPKFLTVEPFLQPLEVCFLVHIYWFFFFKYWGFLKSSLWIAFVLYGVVLLQGQGHRWFGWEVKAFTRLLFLLLHPHFLWDLVLVQHTPSVVYISVQPDPFHGFGQMWRKPVSHIILSYPILLAP